VCFICHADYCCMKDSTTTGIEIGTPLTPSAVKVMLLGSGELGKEVVIEFQRYGVEVISVDRYSNAPAMQVAHRSYTISMLDGAALREVITREKPHYIVLRLKLSILQCSLNWSRKVLSLFPQRMQHD
jgi:formate-dependent phosphoribosylglycinamide formyltransferase (GAR transformylase)